MTCTESFSGASSVLPLRNRASAYAVWGYRKRPLGMSHSMGDAVAPFSTELRCPLQRDFDAAVEGPWFEVAVQQTQEGLHGCFPD
jgi:hypothetical protein